MKLGHQAELQYHVVKRFRSQKRTFVWQCLYFILKMELGIEVIFDLHISLFKDF